MILRAVIAFAISSLTVIGAALDTGRIPPFGWVKDNTVGVVGGIPPRTNGATIIDISQSPYNCGTSNNWDNAVNAAVAIASSNTVLYVPNGTYYANGVASISKSGITLRGQTPRGVRVVNTTGQALQIGASEATPVDSASIYVSALRGASNISIIGSLESIVGDIVSISERNPTNELYQVISVNGYNNSQQHYARVTAKSGTNLTIWPPVVKDFTNSPGITARTRGGLNPIFKPIQYSGVENVDFYMINTNSGAVGVGTYQARMANAVNCWVLSSAFVDAANYNLGLNDVVNCYLGGLTVLGRTDGEAVSNHAGFLFSAGSGVLAENCYLGRNLFPGVEFNSGWAGNFMFACYFTGNFLDILCHNTHPFYNGFEALTLSQFKLDGYFGSSSHQTVFRSQFEGTTSLKRFNTYNQIIGSVLGNAPTTYAAFTTDTPGDHNQIVTIGRPNINNNSFTGTTSNGIAWNYPGGQSNLFTGAQSGTTLNGNFSFVPSPAGTVYALVIQKGMNTNMYAVGDDGNVVVSTGPGTSTSVTLDRVVSVVSGDRLYVAGQERYQQLQSSNRLTDLFHANYDYFNDAQVMAAGYDTSIPNSLLYPSGKPYWWDRTNTLNGSLYVERFPAVQPEHATKVTTITPQIWFADGTNPFSGEAGSGGETAPTITDEPDSQTIANGATATMTVVATGTSTLTYQWYVGTSGSTGSPIGGATSSSYTTPALVSTTQYWVRVTNGFGTDDSVTATITVTAGGSTGGGGVIVTGKVRFQGAVQLKTQ